VSSRQFWPALRSITKSGAGTNTNDKTNLKGIDKNNTGEISAIGDVLRQQTKWREVAKKSKKGCFDRFYVAASAMTQFVFAEGDVP